METTDIHDALVAAQARPAVAELGLSICVLADSTIAFLAVLRDRTRWPLSWAAGRIIRKAEQWKVEYNCPKTPAAGPVA